MDKLKNIDHGVYPIEDINYISYICTDVKKKTYKIDKTIPKHNDRLSHINIFYKYNTIIELTTPEMIIPFGIDKGNGFQMKLQFTNYKSDPNMKSFYDFISNLEFQQMQYIGLDEDDIDLYNSQIYQDKKNKYDPLLTVKIPFIKNKFNVDIYHDEYTLNVLNINKFSKVKCDIYIDKIWKYNEKYICKWKVKKIYVL
tara:strand:+ start:1459 stop:2052 length:594 start_codon:yes stop_codon:yes gene_type:complete